MKSTENIAAEATEAPRDIEIGAEDLDPRILRAARQIADEALTRLPIWAPPPPRRNRRNASWLQFFLTLIAIGVSTYVSVHFRR